MRVDAEKLKSFCTQVMCAGGLDEKDSALFSDSLVKADMRGIGSHGVTRLKTYFKRIQTGLVKADAQPEIMADNSALLLVNGNNTMGVVSASYAMHECIERARKSGACFAAVNGGNHFGYAAYYAEQAGREGMIGIAMANGPVAIPPIGGKDPVVGTNPLAVVIPTAGEIPIELDMATSVVARGKIKLAEKEGRSIPLGWGVDAEGRQTTDPAAVKCVLPFGGAKGFAISLIIDILSSCLSGAADSRTLGSFYDFSGKTQNSGFFVGAVDISRITDAEAFAERVSAMANDIKNTPKAEGVAEIFMPGEIELKKQCAAAKEGIELSDAVIRELMELSKECSVPFDVCIKQETAV